MHRASAICLCGRVSYAGNPSIQESKHGTVTGHFCSAIAGRGVFDLDSSMRRMNESLVRVPVERIEKAIFLIRGQKVMLDRDLASLYEVTTSALKQSVRRNIERFPADFMFVLDQNEFENWRSQFVTSNSDRMGIRYPPMAFTEQGVAMLSSVLRSKRAVAVNVQIMRTFVRLREMLASQADLAKKIEQLERKYDHQLKVVFDAIRQLMIPSEPQREQIGFTKAKNR